MLPLVKGGRRREAQRAHATHAPSSSKLGAAAAPYTEFSTDHHSRSSPRQAGLRCGVPSARPHSSHPLRYVLASAQGCRPRLPGSALFGPARPYSASLGPARLPTPQLLSHALLTWGVGGSALGSESAMWAPGAYCKAIRVGSPAVLLSAALCVWRPASLPWAPKGLRAPPPRSRGASPGKGRGGVGGRSLEGRGEETGGVLDQGPSCSGRRGA